MFRDWFLLGPLSKDEELDPDEIDLEQTHSGKNGDTIEWHRYIEEGKDRFGSKVIDLSNHFGGNEVAAYAYTEVKSDREREVTLSVGSDDSITIWVNGKQVLDRQVARAAEPDQDFARVKLNEGRNRILVRIGQKYGGWGFFFRITDRFGQALSDGLKYVNPRN